MEYYKPIGKTTIELINEIKEKEKVDKITFTGRLDPMAHGKILVYHDISKLKHNHNKKYQFEIIIGIQTDSDDCLGIIEKIDFNLTKEKIIEKLKQVKLDEFEQRYHNFSSKVFKKNKSFFKGNINNYSHKVSINGLKILGEKVYNLDFLINQIISDISKINHKYNFRQNEIINQWENLINPNIQVCSLLIEIDVSSGFYIRQFIRDLNLELKNTPCFAYYINRIMFNNN